MWSFSTIFLFQSLYLCFLKFKSGAEKIRFYKKIFLNPLSASCSIYWLYREKLKTNKPKHRIYLKIAENTNADPYTSINPHTGPCNQSLEATSQRTRVLIWCVTSWLRQWSATFSRDTFVWKWPPWVPDCTLVWKKAAGRKGHLTLYFALLQLSLLPLSLFEKLLLSSTKPGLGSVSLPPTIQATCWHPWQTINKASMLNVAGRAGRLRL